jgi:hypothetical protein
MGVTLTQVAEGDAVVAVTRNVETETLDEGATDDTPDGDGAPEPVAPTPGGEGPS